MIVMKRFQFEVSEARAQDLELLKGKLQLTTHKELINNALSLLEWAVEEYEAGRVLASVDKQSDRYFELLMPALRKVKGQRAGFLSAGAD